MKYADWLVEVPSEITNDPSWKKDIHEAKDRIALDSTKRRLGLHANAVNGITSHVTLYLLRSSNIV